MPVVSGELFSESAYSYNHRGLTYQDYDCVHYTNLVRNTCGLSSLQNGTNMLYRGNGLTWRGTIQEAYDRYGGTLPQGLYLFHFYPDDDPRADPTHYGYGDGIGDVDHVGIYTGISLGVMQSGGYDGSGVHDSVLRSYFNLAGTATGIAYNRTMPNIGNPTQYRYFYCSPNMLIGERCIETDTPTKQQLYNANCIKSKLRDLGWSLKAVCAVLGNMQRISSLNPAYIEETNRYRLPDQGISFDSLYNYTAQFFYADYYSDTDTPDNYGMGLLQWHTANTPNVCYQAKTVAYAINNHALWYDGWYQCKRLDRERQVDSQYHYFTPTTYNGTTYDFSVFYNSHNDISDLTYVFMVGYLHQNDNLTCRVYNAEWWYDYFTDPDAPNPINEPDVDPYVIPDFNIITTLFKKRKELKRPCRRI